VVESGRRYGGRTGEERRAERRERLLDAALELFGTLGYAGTTIEAICAASQLNPRYFYEQFAGREELLLATYDRHMEAVTAAVLASVAQAPLDPVARLEAGLRAFVDAQLADERGAQINYFEIVGVSPRLEQRRRDVLRLYAGLVEAQITALVGADRLPARDYRLTAVALVGATDGLLIDWLSTEPRPDREPVIRELLAIGTLLEAGLPDVPETAPPDVPER
jgi:AcrR family transcriptional regulator